MNYLIELSGRDRYPVAMTIAGSDSGGGAGIQADLKTFAALQVHGTCAITAVTAQNTFEVRGVQALDLDIIEGQIRAVYEDLGIDAAKTGMLFSSKIIRRIARVLNDYDFPLVIDPVMIAKSGAQLLLDEAVEALIDELFPRALIVTPNRMEAEKISGISIRNIDDAKRAAKRISDLGPRGVLVKGGHLEGAESIDVFYYEGGYHIYRSERIQSKSIHGTGCSLSAAITGALAHGYEPVKAVNIAKRLISEAIRFGLRIGRGYGPVNPFAPLYREASRESARRGLKELLEWLSGIDNVGRLVPEVGMNIAYSSIYPLDSRDIIAIPGRIRRLPDGRISYVEPSYGASDHLARYLLKISEYTDRIRIAMNIRYDERIVKHLRDKGFRIGFYDRGLEPPELKGIEGATIPWGVDEAIKNAGGVPDVIYHLGDVGKEPMIILLAGTPGELKKMIMDVLEVYSD